MREITPSLTPDLKKHYGRKTVAGATAFPVKTFRELVEHTARLAYINPDHLLFFRGQDSDYRSKADATTLYPPIYRGDAIGISDLEFRFELLEQAAKILVEEFQRHSVDGHKDLALKKYIQWCVLQHYQVVDTPLLDITQSLSVACSFAQLKKKRGQSFIYVLGLPYVMNRISINSEHDLVNVRLLSICPPAALRPYFQEGYLAGTTDVTTNFASDKTEVDFRRRLIAKFSIPGGESFWKNTGFSRVPESSLYPTNDTIRDLCDALKSRLTTEVPSAVTHSLGPDPSALLGMFLADWIKLEKLLLNAARKRTSRNVSVAEAIRILVNYGRINSTEAIVVEKSRQFRNMIVHQHKAVSEPDIEKEIDDIRWITKRLSVRLH